MKLLDLKYFLLKNPEGPVEGFCSFMPTVEDGYAVIYIYEIHLGVALQGFVVFTCPYYLLRLVLHKLRHQKADPTTELALGKCS